jgi:translocation and assembly module TamB
MSVRKQILVSLCTVLGGVLLVMALGVWWVIESGWLKNTIRERVVAEVERTTGGRVELGGFTYDWQTLSAEFSNFTVHGSEPPAGPPLLRVDSLRVQLKIVSMLERDVDIASLVITRPAVYLLIRPDGTTNVPSPRIPVVKNRNVAEQLLALKIGHLELTNGLLQANNRRLPMDMRAEQVALKVNYNRRRLRTEPSYDIALSSRDLQAGSAGVLRPTPFRLAASAHLERDHMTFRDLSLANGVSSVRASGTLNHFANPKLDFETAVDIEADEIARLVPYRDISGGRLALKGSGHYDAESFSFFGQASARKASYVTQWFAVRDVNLDSSVVASDQGITFRHMVGTSHGAKFVGDAFVKQFKGLEIEGSTAGFQLNELGHYLPLTKLPKPLPWSAITDGHVHLTVAFDPRDANFIIQTKMRLVASAPGIPVSGDVDLTYHQDGNLLTFAQSQVNLQNSQLSFAGPLSGQLQLTLDSSNLNDFKPLLDAAVEAVPAAAQPQLLAGGSAHFNGTFTNIEDPKVNGQIALTHFRAQGQTFDRLTSHVAAAANAVEFQSLELQQGVARLNGHGTIGMRGWFVHGDSPLRADAQFQGLDVIKTLAAFSTASLPIKGGIAAGSIHLTGSPDRPQGTAHLTTDTLDAYGQRLNDLQFDAALTGDDLQLSAGRVHSGAAVLSFSGDYKHVPNGWQNGQAFLKVDSNGFPLASLTSARKYAPGVDAQAQLHVEALATFTPTGFEPQSVNGALQFRKITLGDIAYGDLTVTASTRQQVMSAVVTGDLRGTQLRGTAEAHLAPGDDPMTGEVRFERIALATLYSLSGKTLPPGVQGFAQGALKFDGPLEEPHLLHAKLQVDHLEFSSQLKSAALPDATAPDLVFHNSAPIVVEITNGAAAVRSFQIAGRNTSLDLTGSVAPANVDLKVAGSADLRIFDLFDPNVTATGVSTVSAAIGGTPQNPQVSGTLELKNGSFFLRDLPNGLSAVNGAVTFNRNRATLQKMTATSGGGELSLGGFLSFGAGSPLVYHLEGSAQNVRVRYADSISVTANSSLRLSGSSNSSILSGTLTISRVVFNPNTDVGNLLASFGNGAVNPSSDNEFLTGLHLDVSIESAPNLQLSTALSRDVEAEIALRLRGTPDHPVLLGSLGANQGDIKVFGARYSINRGEVNFVNAVKIEPVLDLDLETQTRGITVDITISGTFSKLNLNYRSDPPLQPRDIIALLTVGRAPTTTNATNSQTVTDTTSLQSGANTVLGQAISPVSNRLSKLFGITNIKIDPLVQGITNTPQARLTLEQQISRDITVTYVTNLSQTSEQIFRMEWSLNRQFSVIALRDDNGEFGIDFQYKKRFK